MAPLGDLNDGEWHRLHPASPLLKGGIFFVAVLGIVVSQLRERLLGLFIPEFDDQGNPVDYVVGHGLILQVLLVVLGVLLVLLAGFYLSWRFHTFRITDEVVEVRSGILFRTNRKARLDRIQGVNIVRPLLARIFGAAKLEINQAGHDANVQLSYLGSAAADDVRREILRLASGTRQAASASATSVVAGQSVLDRRVNEFLAPTHLPETPPESIVKIHLGRLIGSMLLGTGSIIGLLIVAGLVTWIVLSDNFLPLFFVFPSLLGFGSYYVRRFTKSLRYNISGTPDGVRVGFGLLTTTNETLPPGRIHSVEVFQPLFWRPFGWWEIRINRAGHSRTRGADNQANTTLLPVGNLAEVTKVLELMLPDLVGDESVAMIERGLRSRGGDDGFQNSPRRAAWLRPLSWRRNGYLITPDSFMLRRGAVWRRFIVVPQARLQSVGLHQGPLLRMLRLADVQLHTVHGPIRADLDALDADRALEFFDAVATAAVHAGQVDTSHRWRAGEATA